MKTLKKLIIPPLWLMAVLTVFCAAALTAVFTKGWEETAFAYGAYALSFYTLCAVSVFCAVALPKKWRAMKERLHAHPVGHRYLTDAAFRTRVSLHAALGVNLLYAGVNLLSWALYDSAWFAVLAGYYMILAVMRFLLARYARSHPLGENRLGELKRSRLCAGILLLLNFSLTGAVLMILYQDRGFDYHGILIYVMASYTFYSTVHAMVDLVKYRKYKSPVMTVSKIIALCAALVSMLALETAMFARFGGDMTARSQWLMTVLTGAGVSLAVIAMAVYMLVKTAQEIREIQNGREI